MTKLDSYGYHAVPCGQCAICLSNKRVEWSIRILEESKDHKESIFVTLTYRDDKKDVSKEDLRKFIKDLREHYRTNEGVYFRFYALAEYGSKTKRPHYHLVLFGLMAEDILNIEKTWDKGFCTVSILNEARAMYITKYHVNRGNHPSGAEPSFTIMSQGIGRGYLERMKSYHEQSDDNQYYQMYQFKMSLPRYLRDKLYTKVQKRVYSSLFQKKFEEQAKKAQESNKKYWRLRQNQVESSRRKYKIKSQGNEQI